MHTLLLWSLLFYSGLSFGADIVLYACERNGEVTLQSQASNDCTAVQEFRYQSSNNKKVDEGLRKEEARQYEKISEPFPSVSSQIRRYENVDSRIGWAISNDYIDSTQDKCAYYTARLESLFALLGASEPDYRSGATFVPSIDRPEIRQEQIYAAVRQARSQIDYYCR